MAERTPGDRPSRPPSPGEAVRTAVGQAISATAGGAATTRERAQELVGDLTTAAVRVREALEDLRVLDDLRRLRAEVDALADRVAALEGAAMPKRLSPAPRVAHRRGGPVVASAGTKPAGTRAASRRRTQEPAERGPAAEADAEAAAPEAAGGGA